MKLRWRWPWYRPIDLLEIEPLLVTAVLVKGREVAQVGFRWHGVVCTDPEVDPTGRFAVDPQVLYRMHPEQVEALRLVNAALMIGEEGATDDELADE